MRRASAVRERLRSAAAAVTFLTAIPIPLRVEESDLRGGAVLFPVVGALVGGLVALVAWASSLALPPFVAAILGISAGALATAALHLDGLADLADGVGAALRGKDPAAVMRDPRLGTFGGAALGLDLLLKSAVLGELVARDGFVVAAVAAAALARVAPLALAVVLPYVGPADGVGGWTARIGLGVCATALAIAASVGIGTTGPAFGAMALVGGLATALVGRWSAVHLGGVTGDGFGAAAELTETLALTTALAFR